MGATGQKHLLVDGSNIMHAWPELRALLAGDRDTARARLSRAVRILHDLEQVRRVADRVTVLDRRIVVEGPPDILGTAGVRELIPASRERRAVRA